jgi:hypothetical protein
MVNRGQLYVLINGVLLVVTLTVVALVVCRPLFDRCDSWTTVDLGMTTGRFRLTRYVALASASNLEPGCDECDLGFFRSECRYTKPLELDKQTVRSFPKYTPRPSAASSAAEEEWATVLRMNRNWTWRNGRAHRKLRPFGTWIGDWNSGMHVVAEDDFQQRLAAVRAQLSPSKYPANEDVLIEGCMDLLREHRNGQLATFYVIFVQDYLATNLFPTDIPTADEYLESQKFKDCFPAIAATLAAR